ncbi:MurR/RpiR family transcriptional regulator [Labrys monachus]|uniref:DNA-binding MurR/RpiR family transcriptional regulator n=1 Tax=Labrys monachus TaxID=217067 RepID=A0ABU0FM38_9HYPH|nr:MurR/RpiR family transcriptional regulator [Labrys monachus]MDQ0395204.1 DNA-binding MurR/RpiR family transcriptional regulator [Labrys monachus]
MTEDDTRDFAEFSARLAERAEQLPKRLRQVAQFARDHPDEIALGTAASVAENAGVQASTLVRFAKTLGYAGFSDLQQVFLARLKKRFPDYRQRVALLRAGPDEGSLSGPLLNGFADAAVLSVERLRNAIDLSLVDAAIELLAGADIIHLVAARRLFPVTAYLAYAFGNLGQRCALLDHIGQLGREQMALAGPKDVVLAVSYAPYAPATIDLATIAAQRGNAIVAITDSPSSPLARLAAVRLDVEEADHGAFRSLAATFALAMTLAVGTAERKGRD